MSINESINESIMSPVSKPRPNTFVRTRTEKDGSTDYLFVSRYRIKKSSYRWGWSLYIANDEGEWVHHRSCSTKGEAEDVAQEHMGSGRVWCPPLTMKARIARLEQELSELEKTKSSVEQLTALEQRVARLERS